MRRFSAKFRARFKVMNAYRPVYKERVLWVENIPVDDYGAWTRETYRFIRDAIVQKAKDLTETDKIALLNYERM